MTGVPPVGTRNLSYLAKSSKIMITFPTAMRNRMDDVAAAESRTRSDLVREAVRRYVTDAESAARRGARAEVTLDGWLGKE